MNRGVAKIFRQGRGQAVRLPKEFRLPGTEARVTRVGRGVLLEPIETDVDAWLAELRRLAAEADEPFLPGGRPPLPPMPQDDIDLDRDWPGVEKP